MKKINAKKLNQFLMNLNNAPELKSLVSKAAETLLSGETVLPAAIALLNDLGLLTEA